MSAEAPTNPPTRDIEVSAEIAAPRDAVWEAISTADGIASWFSPFASVEEGEGGTVSVAWVEGADWPNRITVWEPGRHLRLVDLSDPDTAAAGAALTLDYHLSTANGKTRVRLVNSCLPATPEWDEHFHMMTNGWLFFLWNLRHALERHPGVPRRMISARPWVTGSREAVWRRLFGEEGVGRVPAEPGASFAVCLDGDHVLEGTVALSDRPWAFAGMVESLNDGVLHVEMEGSGERWKVGVWLSAYGVEDERCEELDKALNGKIGRLFPVGG